MLALTGVRWDRPLAVMLGVLAAAVLAGALYQCGPDVSWLPECWFHRLTGLACPGCGMTRAMHAALHGHLGQAFRFNPVGMLLFSAALLAGGLEATAWACGRPLPVTFRPGRRAVWWIGVILLVFWVVRNLPLWPCVLLVPP